MHTFKDIEGEEWSIVLDVNMTRKIRSELGVDLHSLDKDTIARLKDDDELLVDVISVTCTDQIIHRDLDAKGFASRLVNDVLDDACEALMGELIFISRRNRREVVAKAWGKVTEAETKLTQKAMELLDSNILDEKMDQAIKEAEEALGAS